MKDYGICIAIYGVRSQVSVTQKHLSAEESSSFSIEESLFYFPLKNLTDNAVVAGFPAAVPQTILHDLRASACNFSALKKMVFPHSKLKTTEKKRKLIETAPKPSFMLIIARGPLKNKL